MSYSLKGLRRELKESGTKPGSFCDPCQERKARTLTQAGITPPEKETTRVLGGTATTWWCFTHKEWVVETYSPDNVCATCKEEKVQTKFNGVEPMGPTYWQCPSCAIYVRESKKTMCTACLNEKDKTISRSTSIVAGPGHKWQCPGCKVWVREPIGKVCSFCKRDSEKSGTKPDQVSSDPEDGATFVSVNGKLIPIVDLIGENYWD